MYKYIFHSPIKYLVKSDIDEKEVKITDLNLNREEINNNVNTILYTLAQDFNQYLNYPGVDTVTLMSINGNLLKTIITIDHTLSKKEFDILYTNLQGLLMDTIGKKMKENIIKTYTENIEYLDSGMKKLKLITKYLYCLLWQYDNWKLKFINDSRIRNLNNQW